MLSKHSSHFVAIVACPLIVLISSTPSSPHPTEYFWVGFLSRVCCPSASEEGWGGGKDAYKRVAIPADAELHVQEVSWRAQRQQVQVHMLLAFFVEGFIISKWV